MLACFRVTQQNSNTGSHLCTLSLLQALPPTACRTPSNPKAVKQEQGSCKTSAILFSLPSNYSTRIILRSVVLLSRVLRHLTPSSRLDPSVGQVPISFLSFVVSSSDLPTLAGPCTRWFGHSYICRARRIADAILFW